MADYTVNDEWWTIIENTKEARNNHGHAWGSGDYPINAEQLQALHDGKVLALFDGEYMHFIYLKQEDT